MTDVMAMISVALSDFKAMRDIISIIKQAKNSYENAELQLEFGKLADLLRKSEERLNNIERTAIEKDKKIVELEGILKHKNNITRHLDAYYEKDTEGNASGNPFCVGCWDIHYKKISLIRSKESAHFQVCSSCKNEQITKIHRAPPIKVDQTAKMEVVEKPVAIGNCYQFSDSDQLYCSSCYDNHGKKILLTKLGGRFYQCPRRQATLSVK